MEHPERFAQLPPHVWPRLRALLGAQEPGGPVVDMTIGEPRHAPPPWVAEVVAEHEAGFRRYPVNEGAPELLGAASDWLARRYGVAVPPDRIIALNGTREGLFAAALALSPERKGGRPAVLVPNPFYGVYAVAAAAVGAEPVFVPATEETGHLPDYHAVPADVLDRVTLCYACSPSNPQGAVASLDWWAELLALAERHDFVVVADECYAEIWREAPPPGVLQVPGVDPERVLAIHSLSKRSNLPGLRSGFAAGGPRAIAAMRQLRAYAGAPLPMPLQVAAARVWADEAHVEASRALYREKFDLADRMLGNAPGYASPEAGFFLWLPVPDGEEAALRLWREDGVRVVPGGYLAREVDGRTPGVDRIRVALVGSYDEVEGALGRLRDRIYGAR